jgi:hypothetical protein
MKNTFFVPQKLGTRLSALTEKLIPKSGKATTLEGEMIRAINRIIYRFYNDGDYWFKGCGCETAGSPVAFLLNHCPSEILTDVSVANVIVDYVENKKKLTPNSHNMWDSPPLYHNKYEEDDL